MGSETILVWNVRGLNAGARRNALREVVVAKHPSIICIQETKLDIISEFDIMQLCGSRYEFFSLRAVHTRGGILVAWRASS
jgi:exonuclease III